MIVFKSGSSRGAPAVQHHWSQGSGASCRLATGIFCGSSRGIGQRDRGRRRIACHADRAEPVQQAHQRLR